MEKYLKWRFNVNNHPKYRKYLEEWISGVTESQMAYFEEERKRLIKMGLYNETY